MTIRHASKVGWVREAAAQAARLAGARGWACLLFHHLTDESTFYADDPFVRGLGVDLPVDRFDNLLDYVMDKYTVAALEDVEARSGRRRRRRPVVLCFDDAYASVATLAAPRLVERGLPWVFFVNPGLVDGRALALDNYLAYVANTLGTAGLAAAFGSPVDSLHDAIVNKLPTLSAARRRQLVRDLVALVGEGAEVVAARSRLYLSSDQLRQLASAGVAIGNHTRDHVYCRSLDGKEAGEQIVESADVLRSLAGVPIRSFAYPYGFQADATDVARAAVKQAGHDSAFLVQGRLNTTQRSGGELYRIGVTLPVADALGWNVEILPRLRSAKAWAAQRGLVRQS